MKVRITARARRDLAEIRAWIAADNPRAAGGLVTRLLTRMAHLAEFPGSGRKVPEVQDEALREVIVGHYRVVYRVEPLAVVVLTVFEGHRLPDPATLAGADDKPAHETDDQPAAGAPKAT